MPLPPTTLIYQRVLSAIRRHDLCAPHDCLIVAVSGGADSVALLDLLTNLTDLPLRLVVAHLNHQLRGAESDADESFVRHLAREYGLECEIDSLDIRQRAKDQRKSLEEAGRDARYAFFELLRQRHNAVAIAVAHHADDQAETLLLRLLRGSGTTGLSAMAPRTQACIIRPLLELTRQELRNHLAAQQLTFREDSSNTNRNYLRNRVRHELLPLLQQYNPAISQRLAATADLLGEEQKLLTHYTDTSFDQLFVAGSGWGALPRTGVARNPRGLRLRLYRKAIETLLGDLRRLEQKHMTLLDQAVLEGSTGNRLNLPRGLAAVLTADHLLLARKELLRPPPPLCCTINSPGRYDLGNGLALLVEEAQTPASWQDLSSSITYVAAETAPFPWQVRRVVTGERLELLGMTGSRAVQDILTDQKFPHHLRPALPLLCHNGTPLWLAGVRRTRHALVQPEQQQAMRVTLLGREQLPLFP